MLEESQPVDTAPTPPKHSAVVAGGEKTKWWVELWLRIWPLGASRLHKTVVVGTGLVVVLGIGASAAWVFIHPKHAAQQPAVVATSKNTKTETNGSAKPGDAATTSTAPTPTPASSPAPKSTGGGSGGGSSSGGSSGSSSTCALPKYPDASCTGVPAGTTLSAYTGPTTITTANTVIDGKTVSDCLEIDAAGVVIKNSKLSADCFYVIYSHQSSGARLTIQDSEIDCQNHNGTAIGDTNITALRVNVHGCENGFDVDGNLTVQDSYIHDLTQTGADPHTDGIQITPVGHDINIQHNRIYAFTNGVNGTSAIIEPDANLTNIWIQENLVAGGAYTIYCRTDPAHYGSTWHLLNNHFSTINGPNVGEYGPWTDCDDEPNVSGNVYQETGLPVPLQ
jgi:hypothetical protein